MDVGFIKGQLIKSSTKTPLTIDASPVENSEAITPDSNVTPIEELPLKSRRNGHNSYLMITDVHTRCSRGFLTDRNKLLSKKSHRSSRSLVYPTAELEHVKAEN